MPLLYYTHHKPFVRGSRIMTLCINSMALSSPSVCVIKLSSCSMDR